MTNVVESTTCSAENSQEWTPSRMQRIPTPLQTVFLRSNRGETVNKAPPQRMGHRTFFRNIFFRRPSNVADQKKKVYDRSKDKVLTKSAKVNAVQNAQADALSTGKPEKSSTTKTRSSLQKDQQQVRLCWNT